MWPSWDITFLIFAAAFLEGAAGFDFGLVATPALASLIGVRDSVLTLSLPNLILMAIRAIGGGVPAPSLRRLMPYLGAGAAGAAVGVLDPHLQPAHVPQMVCGRYRLVVRRLQHLAPESTTRHAR